LGTGDKLTVGEIKDMTVKGLDLLTLSACNTATGIVTGDGVEVESFANEILKLGSKAVLATLWPVNDASTGLLMTNFYQNRYGGNAEDKASALRMAQLSLMNENIDIQPSQRGPVLAKSGSVKIPVAKPWDGQGFSHPYYWAPFVIMGNWK
jgi:CHAT domain-containing protein